MVVMVEFIYNHQHINEAKRNETKGKDAQGVVALVDKRRVGGAEEADDSCRENPYKKTGHSHGYGKKAHGLDEHCAQPLVVAFAHLYGSQ